MSTYYYKISGTIVQSFDVIIIGGGPAGSISSYYLSKKGFTVCLLDKKDIGNDKICGGGISKFAINELPFDLPNTVIERKIKGISFITPQNKIFNKKERELIGVTVYRSEFDSYLLKKSIHQNTTFIPNTNVKRITKYNEKFIVENKYKSTYLLGADGANSIVKRIFNIGQKQNSKYIGMRSFINLRENQDVLNYISDKESIDLYFKNGFRGYGWVFPLKEALNIGIGILGKNKLTKDIVKQFALKQFKLPKKNLKEIKIEGFPIPITSVPKNFSKDNLLLIGDAASLVDPMSGEGIHYAIRSGKIAADAIIKDNNGKFNESAGKFYSYAIKQDIISELTISYKLRGFIDRFFTSNTKFWFSLLSRNPFVFNYMNELAIKGGYYNVYKEVLHNLPQITLNTIKGNNFVSGLKISQRNVFKT